MSIPRWVAGDTEDRYVARIRALYNATDWEARGLAHTAFEIRELRNKQSSEELRDWLADMIESGRLELK